MMTMSPTMRTSNTGRKLAIPKAPIQIDESSSERGERKEKSSYGSGKRQLVVLCHKNPATAKEINDQDLAMRLCKNMGIIPSVIVSSLSSENPTAKKEEQLLVDSMSLKADDEIGDIPWSETPSYTYPQFFVRNIVQDKDMDESNAVIDYKGDYDTMEELYRTGMFSAESLEANPDTTARGADETKAPAALDDFIRETSNHSGPRAGIEHPNASVGEPSLPSPQRTASINSISEPSSQPSSSSPRSRSLSPDPNNSINTNSSSYRSSSLSLHMLNMSSSDSMYYASQNTGDASYSHLEGMNQPKMDRSAASSEGFGEMSLGDDLRMIFDIENECGTISTCGEDTNETPRRVSVASSVASSATPTSLAPVETITEDDEDEDEDKDSYTTPAPRRTSIVSVPTIEEEDEEEDEDEDEELEDEDEDDEDEKEVVQEDHEANSVREDEQDVKEDTLEDQKTNSQNLEDLDIKDDAPEDPKTNSASMTVLPSVMKVKRETVTLKPRKERPAEPPGTIASSGDSLRLDQARSSLKPPTQPEKPPFNPVQPKPRKIVNPYYALSYYSGGGEDPQVPESDPPTAKSSFPTTSDPVAEVTDPPGKDAEVTDPPGNNTEPIDLPTQEDDKFVEREYLPWEKKFIGIGACYLVLDSGNDELNIHYSEKPMANAVGVWTSPDIGNFKETQGLSECELIGTCASNVSQDAKYFCQGWIQFVKAAKIMEATVTGLEGVGLPVDIYLYDKGRTIHVTSSDGETTFDTKAVDAVACVPKGCDFQATGIVGKKWGKLAKKIGAVALFKSLSIKKSKDVDDESLLSRSTNTNSSSVREIPVPVSTSIDESTSTVNSLNVVSPVAAIPKSLSSIIDDFEKDAPLSESKVSTEVEAIASQPSVPGCLEGGACYLVYEPDSSGQLVEHYSKTPVDFSIGRWIPGFEKKIAGFKFKRNLGKNVLIGNCSGGVQGRKNFYSGWCQFVRSAKNMNGWIVLWDTIDGRKGLKVDVFLYYDDRRPSHQTVRMEEGISYTTDNILAVACLPKETPFFENMTADLILWLAEGSKHGYSTKL
jgi:hypothetical protein